MEEELNEKAEEVTEPSSPEALLQPRAMMSDSETSGMEEIPMNDEPSDNTEEKVEKQQSPLIQTSNADYKSGKDQEKLRTSVSINLLKAEEGQIQWKVTFDTSEWSFNVKHGGVYFILPNGLDLTKIVDNNQHDITASFPTDINDYRNSGQEKYRFFSSKQGLDNENGFNSQWNWSAGQANPSETVNSWKSGNRLSKIYFINQITDTTELTYTLTAKVTEPNQQSFPLLAVMKSFTYTNSKSTEVTSLGAREITLEKEKLYHLRRIQNQSQKLQNQTLHKRHQHRNLQRKNLRRKTLRKHHKRHRLRKNNQKYRNHQTQRHQTRHRLQKMNRRLHQFQKKTTSTGRAKTRGSISSVNSGKTTRSTGISNGRT